MQNILLISGSLRKDSLNTKLLKAFESLLTEDVNVNWANIMLPLFNQDLEKDFPIDAQKFRDQILAAGSVIIATPEYNRGMPGVLKNAIDWASRPYGQNSFAGKRVLVTSASPGSIGGALASYQVKQSLLHLDARVIGHPECIFGHAGDIFNEEGELVDEKAQKIITKAIRNLQE